MIDRHPISEADEYYFFETGFNLKKEWHGSLHIYTDKELLAIFPEIKKLIPKIIKECQSDIRKKEAEIRSALNQIYEKNMDEFSEWFSEKLVEKFMFPELEILERRLFKLRMILPIINPIRYKKNKFQDQIATARNYPIFELAKSRTELRPSGKNFVSLCCFHNEKTPSLYIYPETNRFYCFGCQVKGNVIDLTMALYGVNFKEAVEMLQL